MSIAIFAAFALSISGNPGLMENDALYVDCQARLSTLGPYCTELTFDSSTLTGSIPTELGALIHLTSLNVSLQYTMTGTIPSEIGALTSLENLSLLGCGTLSGTIPTHLALLTALTNLDLGVNFALTGSIPSALAALTRLESLSFAVNTFAGSIPSQFAALTAAQFMLFFNNEELTGTIPTQFTALTANLTALVVSDTKVCGQIPAGLQTAVFPSSLPSCFPSPPRSPPPPSPSPPPKPISRADEAAAALKAAATQQRVELSLQMTMSGGLATYDDRRRDAIELACERELVGGTKAAGTCFVTKVVAGSVVIDLTVFQFEGRYDGTTPIADKLRNAAVLAKFGAAVEAATGQKVVVAPKVIAARAFLKDGSLNSNAYRPPLLDGELAAVVVCSVVGGLALVGALVCYLRARRQREDLAKAVAPVARKAAAAP